MGRLRKKPWAENFLKESKIVLNEPKEIKGAFQNISNNLEIEIGMGKGNFIETKSKNKDINYIGIEKHPSVQVISVKNIEKKIEEGEDYSNLRYISMDATEITDWFKKETIDTIYLNFSDPWPKEKHTKRRLTDLSFLQKYYKILKFGGTIEIKTDQLPLFEFSLEQIKKFKNYETVDLDRDLHKNKQNIITTEYERKFISMGHPIHYIKLKK